MDRRLITAVREMYIDHKIRKYFFGDADYQRAVSASLPGEVVFEVEIETPGIFNSRIDYGWAVGSEVKNGMEN